MFPRFTDIINYFLGTNLSFPIQTYGFFVAFSFLFGAWILKKEIFRKEKQGLFQPIRQRTLKGAPAKVSELIITAVAGFILGYKFVGIITSYSLFDENPQEYFFSMQGSIIGGIAVAALLAYNRYRTKKKQQLEEPVWEETEIPAHKLAGNILIIAAVSGILGAKIFHNLENIDELIKDPVGSIFSFMGLTFYGGLIVGSITVLWYLKKKKMKVIHVLDAAAPAILISYGIGRLGCMLSGDGCWGVVNTNPKPAWISFLPDWFWSFRFPHNVVNEGIAIDHCSGKYCTILEQPVYPTSLYDFLICLVFFAVLLLIRNRIRIPGLMFSFFLIITGIQRFLMEQIRVNNKYHLGSLEITQAEIISIVILISGLVLAFVSIRKYRNKKGLTGLSG